MDDVIKFKIYFQSSPKAMDSTEKKEGKMEILKCEYLKNEKIFLDEKKHFS